MNKLEHLKVCKQFLRKVVTYRRQLLKNNHGKAASRNMVKTMSEIEYFIPRIISFDKMMNYIGQKGVQKNIKELIPANKKQWKEDFENLLARGEYLQYSAPTQRKLTYSY